MLGVSPTTVRELTGGEGDEAPRLPALRVTPALPRVGLNTVEAFTRGEPGIRAALPEGLPEVLSLTEVGTVLGVSHDVVRRLVTAGELEGFRVTRHFRVRQAALAAFVDRHG